VLASAFAYSRDQERDADRMGAILMQKAGYDVAEAAKVWANLLLEIKARPGGDSAGGPMFATHPPPEEREETLKKIAAAAPGGETGRGKWLEKTHPFVHGWLADEVKRGQHEESIALLTRMLGQSPGPEQAEYAYARGEAYRLRAKNNDLDLALADYQSAVKAGGEPVETYRSLGVIYRQRKQVDDARASFTRYLEAAPSAPDAPMIKSYLEELST